MNQLLDHFRNRGETRVSETAGLIKLKQISENLELEVEGIDLKNKLSEPQIATVYDALIRHKVLVFKDWIESRQRLGLPTS